MDQAEQETESLTDISDSDMDDSCQQYLYLHEVDNMVTGGEDYAHDLTLNRVMNFDEGMIIRVYFIISQLHWADLILTWTLEVLSEVFSHFHQIWKR